MRSFTHLTFSATVTSAFLCTSDPIPIVIGALCGILPDVDTKNSWTGRILRPVSHIVEQYGHRQITHSLLGSLIFGVITVVAYLFLRWLDGTNALWEMVACNIGYSSGWLLDAGSKTGVPVFYPKQKRLVFPFDPEYRFTTGSLSERVFGFVMICVLFGVLYVNGAGGALTSFSNLIGSPSSAVEQYRSHTATHRVMATVKGTHQITEETFSAENLRIVGIIGDTDLIVQLSPGELLQIGSSAQAHIRASHIETHLGARRIKTVRALQIPDELRMSELLARIPEDAEIFGHLTTDQAGGLIAQPQADNLKFHPVTINHEPSGAARFEFRAATKSMLLIYSKLFVSGSVLINQNQEVAE
jgi:inner membrane protein